MIYRRETMRVFLDANILFSASDLRSQTSKTLELLLYQNHEAVTSPYAWGEAQRNVIDKCPLLLTGLQRFQGRVMLTDAIQMLLDVEVEEKDKPILAGAIGARCTHLWTGDKTHFGKFYGKKIQGVTVVHGIHLHALLASF